jgi:propanol-preferring alcohol dehydrogenase
MRAYRLLAWEQAPVVVEVPVPEPGPGEILVQVAGNGLCHSDVTMRQMPGAFAEAVGWVVPFTLGHEIGGRVAALGTGMADLTVGEAVALVSPTSCGRCWWCTRGLDGTCPHGLVGRGYGADGGLADYVLVRDRRALIPLGTLDPVHAAPLTDAGATSHHAVARVAERLEDDSRAVVIGAGGLGAFAVQLLRALTRAEVIAVDTNPARLEYVRELGAHHTVVGVDDDTRGALVELTGGEGAHAVFDFVGVDDTIATGLASVRPAGAFALVGAGNGSLHAPWIRGLPREAEVFTFQGSNIADARAVVRLAEEGRLRADVDRFGFDEIDDAYAAMEAGTLRGRAVVTP